MTPNRPLQPRAICEGDLKKYADSFVSAAALQVARGTHRNIPPAEAEERYYAMLAFPISIMSQWWVRRSSSAAARICLICNRRSIDALADGADSADCRASRLCARPQLNDASPRSPLTTKGHFNSQRSKWRLRAAEPAGQGSGRFWPPYIRPRRVIF
jgi:hypothetical protein